MIPNYLIHQIQPSACFIIQLSLIIAIFQQSPDGMKQKEITTKKEESTNFFFLLYLYQQPRVEK